MDSFVEQIVKKQPTAGDKLKKYGFFLGGIILGVVVLFFTFVMIPFAMIIAAPLAFGLVYGGYYLGTATEVEYEYIFTNGELDIDKIIAKRKRSRLLNSIKISRFEKFGKVADNPGCGDGMTRILATDGFQEDDYYAEFHHDKYGECCLIFSPNERVLEAIMPFVPRNARK